jgi:hypothetical protein
LALLGKAEGGESRRTRVAPAGARPDAYTFGVRRRWTSRRAFTLHIEFAVLVAGCGTATWWQATRAFSGHFLSWFYTFEWPILGVVALAGWWHLIHEDPEKYRARKAGRDDWYLDEDERAAPAAESEPG